MVEYVSEYTFLISKNKKRANKNKNQKPKETKKEKKISRENRLKKNLRPPGLRFFLSPAFPETRAFFWPKLNEKEFRRY